MFQWNIMGYTTGGRASNTFLGALSCLGDLLKGTNLHWRFPTAEEVMEKSSYSTGIPYCQYTLCYNPSKVEFDMVRMYQGLAYSTSDMNKLMYPKFPYSFMPVIDTRDPVYPTKNGYGVFLSPYPCGTHIPLSDLSSNNWHYGFLSVSYHGKWGAINIYGKFVIPMEYSKPITIGFVCYGGRGLPSPEFLGARAEDNDFVTLYRIEPNYQMKQVMRRNHLHWKRAFDS